MLDNVRLCWKMLELEIVGQKIHSTSSGTRTRNLTLRRGAPYPLGHGGVCLKWGSNPRGQSAQQILSLPP